MRAEGGFETFGSSFSSQNRREVRINRRCDQRVASDKFHRRVRDFDYPSLVDLTKRKIVCDAEHCGHLKSYRVAS